MPASAQAPMMFPLSRLSMADSGRGAISAISVAATCMAWHALMTMARSTPASRPPTLNNLVRVIRPHGAHIYVGGAFTSVNQELRPYFFRMNSNGQVDTSFQPLRGITPWTGWGVVDFLIQPDGKIITAGKFLPDDDPDTASPSAFIARLHPDGSLDAEFNQDFELGAYSHINSTARQSNGKLLLAGRFFTIYGAPRDHLIRLDVNGQFDPSFHNVEIGNELEKVIVSPDDSLMVAGSDIAMHQGIRYNHVARLKSNGEIDPAFRAAEFTSVLTYGVYAFDIVKAREGGWVVAGRFTHLDGELRTGLAWLNEDGSLNTEMASADIQGVDVKHLRVPPQRPNLLLVAGKFSHVQGESRNQLTLLKIPRFSIFQDGFEDP